MLFKLSDTGVNMNEIVIKYNIKENDTPELPLEIYGFNNILNILRNKIDKINSDIWKKVRWYINEYDFLVKDPIINRAFYKYWEIINVFNIFNEYTDTDLIFHCAEAPGGFIQGSNIYLQLDDYKSSETKNISTNNKLIDNDGFTTVCNKKKRKIDKKYKVYTISLNKDLPQYKLFNLPSYNKIVINKNICVTFGKDYTGDINNLENINYIKNLIGNNKGFYLVTADGGFDEGTDFNNKEQLHYYLILNEIYAALYLQQFSGTFILKVFDIFTTTSIHLLYLLKTVYREVYIYKPKTSRPTNSEKYVICKNFIGNQNMDTILLELKQLSEELKNYKKYTSFTLFNEIPKEFIDCVKDINTNLLNVQCDSLQKAIDLCENEIFVSNYQNELDASLEKRRKIFKQWEEQYNLNCYIPS